MNETELAKLLRDNPDLREANQRPPSRGAVFLYEQIKLRVQSEHDSIPVNGKPVTITLPWPPSLNKLYRHTHRGVLLSTAALKFKAEVHYILRDFTDPITTACAVTIHQYRPRQAGDIDNYQKLLLDACQGYTYVNDKQVTELHVYQHIDRDNPRIVITVTRKETP